MCNRCHQDHCHCNANVLEATNITVIPGTQLTIEVIADKQFKDYGVYVLEIPQHLPPLVGTEAIYISSGGVLYYVLDRAGNIARAGRIRGHKGCGCKNGAGYRIIYGSDGNFGSGLHFEFMCNLDCMRFSPAPTLYDGIQASVVTSESK